nr:hypothetical protein [Tanacetum cinerariifolium]
MDNPSITMEEYIRLEEEKARRHGKVYNWETAKYGKIWYDEDVHDLRSVESEFPAIVFNDELSSEKHSLVNPRDLENDNEKVNMTSLTSPGPKVSCFDDLDFFKDFENEFPAIVSNDALTSKSDFLTQPTLKPQHIDEFDLKDETSLFEYDEVKQNVLYFNDLFPFNIIYPDDLKSDKDTDDDKSDIIQSMGIVAWNYLVNGMLLNLTKNLYVAEAKSDVFAFDDAVRVNTLELTKLMNFFRSRKFDRIVEEREKESDEFVLNHEGDKNDSGVISLKGDLTIKVQNKMKDNWLINFVETIETNVRKATIDMIRGAVKLINNSTLMNTSIFDGFVEVSNRRRDTGYLGDFGNVGTGKRGVTNGCSRHDCHLNKITSE